MTTLKVASIEHYESVSALWDAAMQPEGANSRYIKSIERDHGSDWLGASMETIKASRFNGWPDGAKRIQSFAETIKANVPVPESIRRKIKWSDQGDSLDIHRVWSGRIGQAWESHPRQKAASQKTVTIFAQLWQVNYSTTDSFFWRGAACLTLADILTEAGYNVEIFGGSLTYNVLEGESNVVRGFTCQIKAATAPMDINSLAATVGLSGFCRYTIFRLFGTFANRMGKQAFRYSGSMLHNKPEQYTEAQRQLREQLGMTWDFDSTFCEDEASARKWIEDCLNKLNGEGE